MSLIIKSCNDVRHINFLLYLIQARCHVYIFHLFMCLFNLNFSCIKCKFLCVNSVHIQILQVRITYFAMMIIIFILFWRHVTQRRYEIFHCIINITLFNNLNVAMFTRASKKRDFYQLNRFRKNQFQNCTPISTCFQLFHSESTNNGILRYINTAKSI